MIEFFRVRVRSPLVFSKLFWSIIRKDKVGTINNSTPFIHSFFRPAYPWGAAGAAARVGAYKHLNPLQQRIDAVLGCQGETN